MQTHKHKRIINIITGDSRDGHSPDRKHFSNGHSNTGSNNDHHQSPNANSATNALASSPFNHCNPLNAAAAAMGSLGAAAAAGLHSAWPPFLVPPTTFNHYHGSPFPFLPFHPFDFSSAMRLGSLPNSAAAAAAAANLLTTTNSTSGSPAVTGLPSHGPSTNASLNHSHHSHLSPTTASAIANPLSNLPPTSIASSNINNSSSNTNSPNVHNLSSNSNEGCTNNRPDSRESLSNQSGSYIGDTSSSVGHRSIDGGTSGNSTNPTTNAISKLSPLEALESLKQSYTNSRLTTNGSPVANSSGSGNGTTGNKSNDSGAKSNANSPDDRILRKDSTSPIHN